MYAKIDILLEVDDGWHYLCSTTQSKTCKEAAKKFKARWAGRTFSNSTGSYEIKNNSKIKAHYDQDYLSLRRKGL